MRVVRRFHGNDIWHFHLGTTFLFGLLVILLSSVRVYGADLIQIGAIEADGLNPVDTIYTGSDYELRLWFENDSFLGGISHGFRLRSPDPVTWTWVSQGNGHGTQAAVTIVPGCRMDPSATIWDFGFLVNERDADGISPDSIFSTTCTIVSARKAGTPVRHS